MKQQLAYLVIVIIAVLLATQVAPAQAGSVTYYFNNSLDGWSMERAELADLPPVMGGLPPVMGGLPPVMAPRTPHYAPRNGGFGGRNGGACPQ